MKLTVEGMTCGHCVRSITRAIQSVETSAEVNVDLERGIVAIEGRIGPEAAKAAIEARGYTQVAGLVKDAQGIWRGKAMRDGREVAVSLDYQGNVN